MSASELNTRGSDRAVALDAIIATDQLAARALHRVDEARETKVLLDLTRELAAAPRNLFQTLSDAALDLCAAGSAGISLMVGERFVWPAVAGGLKPFIGEGTPRDFGPCGTVIDRDLTLLFQHPERHFEYLRPIQPSLEEVLIVPFYVDGKALGTVWAVMHDNARKFDLEDQRLLESVSSFAASAYRLFSENGTLEPLLYGDRQPAGA